MITLPPEYYQLPGLASTFGLSIGLFRGSRKAGLQYLAENAHKAPRTVKGWYEYKKVKNSRMILAGLHQGGKDALKLAALGVLWVTAEEVTSQVGPMAAQGKELVAAVGVSAVISSIYRLPKRQVFLLGFTFGLSKMCLRHLQAPSGPAAHPPVNPQN
ncbi:hypothetical protein BKA62DRAFT_826903 [Auriculariales sp. MPI-PUGE-AT-0066]|nr:hypothetical protein BKA62DRAFT_826903 [Auriculariales sp. MPI-PUGE-AT-0066]